MRFYVFIWAHVCVSTVRHERTSQQIHRLSVRFMCVCVCEREIGGKIDARERAICFSFLLLFRRKWNETNWKNGK